MTMEGMVSTIHSNVWLAKSAPTSLIILSSVLKQLLMQQLPLLPILLLVMVQTKEQEALKEGTIDQEEEMRKVAIILTYLVLLIQMETIPITPERDQISPCLPRDFCSFFRLFIRFPLHLPQMLPSKLSVAVIWKMTGLAGRFCCSVVRR